jgi:hypothetical protein
MDSKMFQKDEYFYKSFFMREDAAKFFTCTFLKNLGLL